MNTKTVRRLSSVLCVASLAAWLPVTASAQPTAGAERGSIMLGAFVTNRDSEARLDSDSEGDGTELNLEDDLGLDSSMSVARLGGYLWLGRRHRFDAGYFDLSRSASRTIQETINFGDQTFAINTVVESEQKLTILKTDYTFAVLAKDRGWLGVTGGLYVAKTTMSLRQATLGQFESEDLTAPLPLFGVRGDYAINDHITLRGAVQWFGFKSQDVDGRLTDLYVGADYGFGKRMAVGVAYDVVAMNLGARDEEGFRGRLNWGYDGLLLYFKVDFGDRN